MRNKEWGDNDTDFDDGYEFDGDVVDDSPKINLALVVGGIAVVALILAILGLVL